MDNLSYYNAFRQPPQEALKEFNNGSFKGTDINTMRQTETKPTYLPKSIFT